MSRLPRVTAAEVASVLGKCGFSVSRQSGSHQIWKDAQNRRVTLPVHAGKVLKPKTLRSILRDAGLTADEFRRLLKDP
jgi:predicted RNA binding protein YcfA (HicA-like mRNA interferase family)